MIKNLLKNAIVLIFILVFQTLTAQIPEGGAQLNATTGTTFQRIGGGTLTTVSVTGQSFTTALRMVTGSPMNNAWDSQIRFPAVAGIASNDVILVAFWARTISTQVETGEGQLIVVIENNSTYAKEIYQQVNIGADWKQYFAPVKVVSTLASNQVSYAFFTGFANQTIEIADVKYLNYKNTLTLEALPVTEITYIGQAPDAPWRQPAQERISLYRKGTVTFLVVDENGVPVPDAELSIEMTRHQFGFGTAIPASRFLTNATFRNKVYELFNEVVFENDLKWTNFNPASTLNLRNSLDSLEKRNIPVRGHTVVWPAWRWLPTWLRQYETDPVALRMFVEKRIEEVVTFGKGRLVDWDVLNEPYSEKDLMTILGNDVMADWFKRTRIYDRGVKLYINDYAILSGGGYNQVKQDFYFNLVKQIDNQGGQIDGIGFQGHFGGDLTSVQKVYDIIDRYAALGKEIKITEHDINVTQRAVQADYTRDFMTIVFSHPSVKSFLFWGFWESSHWMPNAAFYNADWSIRPHGEMYKEMVFNQWWTPKTELATDDEGIAGAEGFLGTYKYTLTVEGAERTGTFTIENSNHSEAGNPIILSLDASVPEQIKVTAAKPGVLCEGETIILSAPVVEGFEYAWYRNEEVLAETNSTLETGIAGAYKAVMTKGDVTLESPAFEVVVNPIPEASIAVTGQLAFCPGGSVKLTANAGTELTYDWMRNNVKIQGSVSTLVAKTAGTYTLVTHAKGCKAVSEPVVVQVYDANDEQCTIGIFENNESVRIYPNPFRESFTLEIPYHLPNGIIEVYNTVGQRVFVSEMSATETQYRIPVSEPGFYTVKLSNNEGSRTFRIVGN